MQLMRGDSCAECCRSAEHLSGVARTLMRAIDTSLATLAQHSALAPRSRGPGSQTASVLSLAQASIFLYFQPNERPLHALKSAYCLASPVMECLVHTRNMLHCTAWRSYLCSPHSRILHFTLCQLLSGRSISQAELTSLT